MIRDYITSLEKSHCSGCSACANGCPVGAISMKPDEYGFLFPTVDESKCINCGLCDNVCPFIKPNDKHLCVAAYAMQATDDDMLKASASGGVFASLAKEIIAQGGMVAGCTLEHICDGGFEVKHIIIHSTSDLYKLQGSKYVQSSIGETYVKVKECLNRGIKVLFSGTPCQVDGLKSFLGNTDYPNLLTVDIICHGVPNAQMFDDYIKTQERKLKSKITDFYFRDKLYGWGLTGSVSYTDSQDEKHRASFPARKSSFYKLFLSCEIFRDCCYHCPYASLERPADLTLGDFWGIEKWLPESIKENGGPFKVEKGISCMLVNTAKGVEWAKVLTSQMRAISTDYHLVTKENHQLSNPSDLGKNRDKVLELYRKHGYGAVEKWFHMYDFIHRMKRKVFGFLKRK